MRFDRSGLDPKFEKEVRRLADEYFNDETIEFGVFNYIKKHASKELLKAMEERNKYVAEKRAKGIIAN